jgi:hypothetical protein
MHFGPTTTEASPAHPDVSFNLLYTRSVLDAVRTSVSVDRHAARIQLLPDVYKSLPKP